MEIVRALDRGLELLLCLAREGREVGPSELAKILDLPKATVIRLARTLEAKEFLKQNPKTGAYQLGVRNLLISESFLNQLDFRDICRPHMEKLRDLTNESVSLYVADGDMRVCVDRMDSRAEMRPIIRIGATVSIAKGAAGKILLAFSKDQKEFYGVPKNDIDKVKADGYAISYAERADGIVAVAVPVLDHTGKVVCSLSLNGPSVNFNEETLQKFIPLTIEAGRAASEELGFV